MKSELFHRLITMSSTTEFVAVGGDGRVQAANGAFVRHVEPGGDDVTGRSISDFLITPDADRVQGWLTGSAPPSEPVRLNFLGADEAPYTLRCVVARNGESLQVAGEPEAGSDGSTVGDMMRLNNELATMARERVRRQRELERTRRELKTALDELQSSYWHLQKIREVLPVCMRCGKVETDEAQWQTLVEYLMESEILMSHGYCPRCTEVVFRESGLEEPHQE